MAKSKRRLKRKDRKHNNYCYDDRLYFIANPKPNELNFYRNIVRMAKIEAVVFDILYISVFIIGIALWFFEPPAGITLSLITAFPVFFWMRSYQFTITDKFNFNCELGLCECYRRERAREILLYYEKIPDLDFSEKNIFQKLFSKNQRFGKLLVFDCKSGKKGFNNKIYNTIKSYKDKYANLEELIKTQLSRPILIDLEDKVSKININKANVAQLIKLPFIDKETAAKIVMRVNSEGNFISMWDFAEFIKLEQEQMEALLKLVYIEPPKETIPKFIRQLQSSPKNTEIDNSLDI